jgi:hypothetical protein
MATPVTLFASPASFLIRYDPRRLSQLATILSDPNEPLPNDYELQQSPLVYAALGDATEIILSAAQVGKRYTRAILSALAADFDETLQYGKGGLLVRLCCDLAYGLLVGGKGQGKEDQSALAPRQEWADNMLELLKQGERVFDHEGAIDAGKKVVGQNVLSGGGLNITGTRLTDDIGMFGTAGLSRRGFRSGPSGPCC